MKAISSMATRQVLSALLESAVASGFPLTELESVGGIDAARRVRSGEPVDLVFLADDVLRRLAEEGHIEEQSITPLVLSQVAVAVRAEEASMPDQTVSPAFGNRGEFVAALLSAPRIGYSTGPSGTELVRMIEGWNLGDVLGPRLVQARPGVPVAALLAEGEVDLGLQQLSELVGKPGVRILGVLPPDCAIDTVFSGAVSGVSADPRRAFAMLEFLATDRTASIKWAHNFDTP